MHYSPGDLPEMGGSARPHFPLFSLRVPPPSASASTRTGPLPGPLAHGHFFKLSSGLGTVASSTLDGLYYAPPLTESSSVRRADAGLIERGAIIVLDTVYVTRLSFADASTCEHALTPAIGMLKEMHDLSAPNKALQLQAA